VNSASTAWLVGAGLCLVPLLGHAEDSRREQCIRSYETGQRLEKTGNLVEAASRLAFCASPTCPTLMRQDCAERLRQVNTATPSLLLTITFGGTRAPVRVSIDGQGRSWAEDAPQVIVNPGRHELRVEAEGFKTQTRQLLVGEGEQSVPVELRLTAEAKAAAPPAAIPATAAPATAAPTMHAPPAPTPPTAARAIHAAAVPDAAATTRVEVAPADPEPPTAAIWVAASSLIGLTGFAYFGLKARQRESQLEEQCQPMCTSAQVNEVRRDYLLANIGLGLGVGSLVASGILFLAHSSKSTAGASKLAPTVQLSPASVGLAGSF
jgi:hypothetical protein